MYVVRVAGIAKLVATKSSVDVEAKYSAAVGSDVVAADASFSLVLHRPSGRGGRSALQRRKVSTKVIIKIN